MPFTSTASMAKHMGKPSVYYDPTNKSLLMQKNDLATHGIEIINDPMVLKEWLKGIFDRSK